MSAPNFIVRDGSVLRESSTKQPFRFISYNVPNLHLIEDHPSGWTAPTEFEQTDALESIYQIGGRVARIYCFSVQKPTDDTITASKKHFRASAGLGTDDVVIELNERLFVALDRAIAIAGPLGVRIIIPFIDNWEWWGGTGAFASLHGHSNPADFYTSPIVKTSFQRLIRTVINRNNTISGIRYRDDPTILTWETGNELEKSETRVPAAWTAEMASFIKSIDPNHLVMDGSYGKHGWDDAILMDSNVDIFSNHYYPGASAIFSAGEYVGLVILMLAACLSLSLAVIAIFRPRIISWLAYPTSPRETAKGPADNKV